MLDMVGRAKWDSWNSLGDMTQGEAMQEYVKLVNELSGSNSTTEETTNNSGNLEGYPGLKIERRGKLRIICFDKPKKKNAIDTQMYRDIVSALSVAAKDPETSITVFTGTGDYFSSGNDLSNFANIEGTIKEAAENAGHLLRDFVGAFIDFPKPLIAMVNGPAVGISVTLLGLFDAVYASDKATFQTPFSALGQTPEACSSLTFPNIMGLAKAGEVLFFNKKLTAKEAKDRGLVTEIFPDASFRSETLPLVEKFSQLPVNSLVYSKELVRSQLNDRLHKINQQECDRLVERWQSADCIEAIMNFFSSKAKI
ncbi:enoyl-CoA delta isomerase 2-like isoform X2 [Artemia franciscana]